MAQQIAVSCEGSLRQHYCIGNKLRENQVLKKYESESYIKVFIHWLEIIHLDAAD